MKKLLTFLGLSFFAISSANAEVSVGLSGTLGMLSADGKETISGSTNAGVTWGATSAATRAATATAATSQNESDDMAMGFISGFAEAHLGSSVRAGVSFVPYALESETTENSRHDACSHTSSCTETKNKVQVDLVNLASVYLAYHTDMFFVKAGVMSGDIETDESLATGAKYGDASLEGTFVGAGIERELGVDTFVRTEVMFTKFDDIKMTGTSTDNTNTINITNLDGVNATISVGKTF